MSNICKTVTVTDRPTMMVSMEVEYDYTNLQNHPWAIDWHHDIWGPWTVLDVGHRTCTSNISNALRDTMVDTRNHQCASDWHHDL